MSLGSITQALLTAARLSQQAELGGILEEIEVSFTIPSGLAVPQMPYLSVKEAASVYIFY